MSRSVWMVTCAVALWAQSASAQDTGNLRGGQGWTLFSGQSVGRGANVIAGQLGWPGLSITWLNGYDRDIDLGARFTPINYGFEGLTRTLVPGMKLQAVARLGLVNRGRFSLGVEFAPGPLVYFERIRTQWGLAFPLELQMGFAVGSAIVINGGLDLPMFVTFVGSDRGLYVPILLGTGVEYFIERRIAASFNLRVGPSIHAASGRTDFAMDALIGVAYRF